MLNSPLIRFDTLDKCRKIGASGHLPKIVSGSPLERLVLHKGLLMGHWPYWDYKIEDDAVDKMFRINSLTFHREGSPYPGLSHLIIALSYRSQLINKFYPGKLSKRLSKYTRGLIIRFNEFTLENLIHIYKLTVDLESMEEIDALYKELEDNCRSFISEAEEISSRMWKLQILEGKFRDLGLKDSFQNSNLFHRFFKI